MSRTTGAASERESIRPQPGAQERFLASPADVAIYGGAAGGGKSWALLLEPLRHGRNPDFGAVIFRRTSKQVTAQGGLWDASRRVYPLLQAQPRLGDLQWVFRSGARVGFAHLQYEDNVLDWQGSEIPLIGFDELTHFTEYQFFYMLSRNRSTSGVRPYVRATCNPDADSWVARFIAWWIDQDTGYAVPGRAGVLRWFARTGEQLVWADTAEELAASHPGIPPKSVTFIPATLQDNKILMERDPGYLANLMAQPLVERERLLGGNWKIKPAAGRIFNRDWFEVVDAVPAGGAECRYWDFAATAKTMAKDDPDYTASCLVRAVGGVYYILDATAIQAGPADVERALVNTTKQDHQRALAANRRYAARWEIEPGSAAKRDNVRLVQLLAGHDARGVDVRGDKITRAKGLAAQAEVGNVKLVKGAWNERWLQHMHHQPDWPHDDEMDAAAGAFNDLTAGRPFTWAAGGATPAVVIR